MYVDTDSRRVIWDGQGPVSFDEERLGGVGVSEYLTAYGVSVTRYADSLEPDLRQAAYAIGRSHAGPNLMKQIKGDRMPCQDHHEAVYLPSQTLAESGRDLLFKVCELLSDRKSVDLEERPDGVELTVRTGDEPLRKFFWGGRWLEYYVFETICRLAGEELGISYNPPWRNVLLRWAGIKYSGLPEIKGLQGPANELDVAVTRGARLLVCECKTGKHVLSPDHLYKLQVIGHKLGTFADKVLVTDAEDLLDRSNRSTRQGVVRALTLNTVVIEASQLPGLADILKDPEKESRRQKRCFGLAA
jgi:hypothetical protein